MSPCHDHLSHFTTGLWNNVPHFAWAYFECLWSVRLLSSHRRWLNSDLDLSERFWTFDNFLSTMLFATKLWRGSEWLLNWLFTWRLSLFEIHLIDRLISHISSLWLRHHKVWQFLVDSYRRSWLISNVIRCRSLRSLYCFLLLLLGWSAIV